MRARIFGLENEYGVTFTDDGARKLSPDDIARALFRNIIDWGRSSNLFLPNGARFYLDVGAHPEYATPECLSAYDATVYDRAGERLLESLIADTTAQFTADGIHGTLKIFKNNTDFAGNSYGAHENYLIERTEPFRGFVDDLLPFLVSRLIFAGAGKITHTADGPIFSLTQRAEHIWESVSSASTRSRPMINSRDEPHADAEKYRRLHVILGDSNMSEFATWLKMATCDLVLRTLEEGGVKNDFVLAEPAQAMRTISFTPFQSATVELVDGTHMTPLELQWAYFQRVETHLYERDQYGPDETRTMGAWRFVLETLETDFLQLATHLDWVAKHQLVTAYQERHGLTLDDPRLLLIDLNYHDISQTTGLYYLLRRKGQAIHLLDDADIDRAKDHAPHTRAQLRGRFVAAATQVDADYTVDWINLKINTEPPRTVVCLDPFATEDVRVDRLIRELTANR
jgi:proteasome accessory factor A